MFVRVHPHPISFSYKERKGNEDLQGKKKDLGFVLFILGGLSYSLGVLWDMELMELAGCQKN